MCVAALPLHNTTQQTFFKTTKIPAKISFCPQKLVVCSALVATAPMYSNWGLGCIYQVQVTSRHFKIKEVYIFFISNFDTCSRASIRTYIVSSMMAFTTVGKERGRKGSGGERKRKKK